jgi:hypothetical protein
LLDPPHIQMRLDVANLPYQVAQRDRAALIRCRAIHVYKGTRHLKIERLAAEFLHHPIDRILVPRYEFFGPAQKLFCVRGTQLIPVAAREQGAAIGGDTPRSQVRMRLAGGGRWIRTVVSGKFCKSR